MFASPYIWGFLPLLLLPVVIHLIHRQKYPRFAFSSLMFFDRMTRENTFRWRLQNRRLMLLRLAIVFFLLLAFARLGCRDAMIGDRSEATVFILDASPSMTRRFGDGTMLDFAKRQAETMIDTLSPNSMVGLIVNTSPPQFHAIPDTDREALREAMAAVEPFYGRQTSWDAVDVARDRLHGIRAGLKRIIVLTDGQRSAWEIPDEPRDRRGDRGVEIELVALGGMHEPNLAIAGVEPPRFGVTTGQAAQFLVTAVNYTHRDAATVRIEAGLGNSSGDAEETFAVAIRAGETATVSFYLQFAMPGPQHVWFRVPDGGSEVDNTWIEPVDVADTVSVACIGGREPAKPPANEADGETSPVAADDAPEDGLDHQADAPDEGPDDPFYLERALSADLKRLRLDVNAFSFAELAEAGLYGYGCVFLASVPELTGRHVDHLESYLLRGGGLVVFLGAGTNTEAVNRLVHRGEDREPLLPATVDGVVHESSTLADVRFAVDESLRDLGSLDALLTGVRYSRRYALRPVDEHARVVATFDDGSPAIVVGDIGYGKAVIVAGGVAWPQTDLANHAVFPALVHRLAESLSGGMARGRRQLVPGDAFVAVHLNVAEPDAVHTVAPSGEERAMSTLALANGFILYDGDTDKPGYYSVAGVYSTGMEATAIDGFAVNPGAANADLRQAAHAAGEAVYAGAPVRWTALESDETMAAIAGGATRDATRLVLLLLAGMLLTENLVSWKTKQR